MSQKDVAGMFIIMSLRFDSIHFCKNTNVCYFSIDNVCIFRTSSYTAAKDKMEHEMNFGVVRVGKMDWFNKMVHTGRAWEDEVCNTHCSHWSESLFTLTL